MKIQSNISNSNSSNKLKAIERKKGLLTDISSNLLNSLPNYSCLCIEYLVITICVLPFIIIFSFACSFCFNPTWSFTCKIIEQNPQIFHNKENKLLNPATDVTYVLFLLCGQFFTHSDQQSFDYRTSWKIYWTYITVYCIPSWAKVLQLLGLGQW